MGVLENFDLENQTRKISNIHKDFLIIPFFIHNILSQNVLIPPYCILPTHTKSILLTFYNLSIFSVKIGLFFLVLWQAPIPLS